jgi:hypothetical protein
MKKIKWSISGYEFRLPDLKNIKRYMRLTGYVVLIILAVCGLSLTGAPPAMMKTKSPGQWDDISMELIEEGQEDETLKVLNQKKEKN